MTTTTIPFGTGTTYNSNTVQEVAKETQDNYEAAAGGPGWGGSSSSNNNDDDSGGGGGK